VALLRRVLGDTLRGQRLRQRRTLREVSSSARVSLGYLSEIERGQKEASSELLAAICDALGVRLSEVLREVSDTMYRAEAPVRRVPVVPRRELAGVGAAAPQQSPAPPLPAREDGSGSEQAFDPRRDDEQTDVLDRVGSDRPLEPVGSEQALLDRFGSDAGRAEHRDEIAWASAAGTDGLDREIRSLTERHVVVAAA
jgi:transcriptional regulator with XRE-family HTH domain